MEGRREEDAGAIAWPGFVDILSAVIIMFVFFLMITAIVMFVLSVQTQGAMESENEEKVKAEIENLKEQVLIENDLTPEEFQLQVQKVTEVQNLSEENKNLNEEVQNLSAEIKQLKADLAASVDQNALVSQDEKSMVVLYKENEMSLSPVVESMIRDFIDSNASEVPGAPKIVLETGDSPDTESLSFARELALARTLNVRNVMLDQEMASEQISVNYTDPEEVEGSYHWVRIRIIE